MLQPPKPIINSVTCQAYEKEVNISAKCHWLTTGMFRRRVCTSMCIWKSWDSLHSCNVRSNSTVKSLSKSFIKASRQQLPPTV